jgi:hypothetical protein
MFIRYGRNFSEDEIHLLFKGMPRSVCLWLLSLVSLVTACHICTGTGLEPIVQAQPACVAGNVDNGSYVTYKMFLDYMVERFMSTYVFRR